MTALNYVLDSEFLWLVTDTLCTATPKNRPYIYSTKVHAIPHLSGILAMTGQGLFALECLKALMVRLIARDVMDADPDVPEIYRELWEKHLQLISKERTHATNVKTTIYHFGWVQSENRIVGLEYKAENNFVSERIPDGCWMHPNTVPDITVRQPHDLIRITMKQKTIDDALPSENRAGIGEDFHFVALTKDRITIQRVFRSDDFDKVYNEMVEFGKSDGSANSQLT
jgi:hypothetical protein